MHQIPAPRTALGDSLGRRTLQTRGNGVTTSYGYDNASRLTSLASDLSGTGNDLTLGMSYNAAGQIKSNTRSNDAYSWTGAKTVTRSYAANGLNQFSGVGSYTTLGYDARGNLTSDTSTDPLNSYSSSYTYSSENLLLTGPAGASLIYDPLNRLYEVSNTATAATRFTYDGGNLIATSNSSGTWQRRYVTAPGSDEIVAEYKLNTATVGWKILDERGSVVNSTDASGAGTAPNTYDEYGIPGNNAMRYQYTGQIWLPEVGLYYYKARMYSPTLGRFMQTDPIGYGDGMNWYNYVKGDPVNRRDPTGMDACYELGLITARPGYGYTGYYIDENGLPQPENVRVSPVCGGSIHAYFGGGGSDFRGGGGGRGGIGPFKKIDILPYTPINAVTALAPKYCYSLLYAVGEGVDEVGGYVNDAGTAAIIFGASVFGTSWFTGLGAEAGITIMGAGGTVYAGGTAISTLGTGIKWIAGQDSMVTATRLFSVPTMSLKPIGQVVVNNVQSNLLEAPDPCG